MRLPVADEQANALAAIYAQAQQELDAIIAAALTRGADGSAAFYKLQLARAEAITSRLGVMTPRAAAEAAAQGYVSGALIAERTLGIGGGFSGIHADAVKVLADNLVTHLSDAVTVVGRQAADVIRQAGVTQTAAGLVEGRTGEATAHAIVDNLKRDGVTAFVDKRGARWPLRTYARMAARTTTREAVSHGTANRMLENGHDLVTISSHPHDSDICDDYDGQTFSLSGDSGEYPALDEYPPFHPNCRHVMTPAAASFAAFEAAVQADAQTPRDPIAKAVEPPAAPVVPPAPVAAGVPRFDSVEQARAWTRANLMRGDRVKASASDIAAPEIVQSPVLTEFGGASVENVQSMIDGIHDVLGSTDVRLTQLYVQPLTRHRGAMGLYSTGSNRITMQPTIMRSRRNAENAIAKMRDAWTAKHERAIESAERGVARLKATIQQAKSPRMIEAIQKDLDVAVAQRERVYGLKRWIVGQDADDPVRALAAHEAGHALMYQSPGLRAEWRHALEDERPGAECRRISEYAIGPDTDELWAECVSAVAMGETLPPKLARAFERAMRLVPR